MRVQFKKSDLLPAAAVVQGIANPQSTLPILSNVLLTSEHDNVVSLSATDYETRVKINIAAEVDRKGTTSMPAKTFYDLVKELPEDGEVVIETKEKAAVVRCREIRCELQTMPARDFPNWPEMDPKVTFDMEQKHLKAMLEKVLFAIPVRDPRKVLLGALLEFKNNRLSAIATDGKILAYSQAPTPIEAVADTHNIVVPHKILEELVKILGEEGLVNIAFDDRQISFQVGEALFVSNQIEGKYPNYEAVIPKEFSREMRFQKPPVLSAIRRASILTDIKNNAFSMIFTEDASVVVEAESYDKGRIREEIPAVTEGDEFKIVFNYRFVSEVLKATESEEVVLQVNQPSTPAVFRGATAENSFYLVMPIKLTEITDYEDSPQEEAEAPSEYSGAAD